MFPQTWEEAELTCEQDRAHLAVPDTAAEAAFLGGRTWLGLSDRRTPGTFVTVTGHRPPFTAWQVNEPRLLNACAQTTSAGTWVAVPCNFPFFFICEYDGVRADPNYAR